MDPMAQVYVIQCRTPKGDHYAKIGYALDPAARLRDLQAGNPFLLELAVVINTPDAEALEAALHDRYRDKQIRGEWFKLTPADIKEIREGYANGR